MRKRMLVILLLAAALLLTACGNNNEAKPAETAAAKDVPLLERVEAAAEDASSLASFSAEELADMAGIDAADYTDFVFLQGNGMDGREILVLRAKDTQAAERLAEQMQSYLERRREEMDGYAPEAYRLYTAAKVERKNLLLVMISGEKAESETAALLAGE